MRMRQGMSTLMMVGILGSASTLMIACDKPAPKGPVEKAGEKVDKAMDKVSDAVDPKGPAEKAGRAIDRATDN